MKSIRTSVEEILQSVLSADVCNINSGDDLFNFGLDSINCINLIIEIEDRFKISIPESNLSVIYLRTINDISNLISSIITENQQL